MGSYLCVWYSFFEQDLFSLHMVSKYPRAAAAQLKACADVVPANGGRGEEQAKDLYVAMILVFRVCFSAYGN